MKRETHLLLIFIRARDASSFVFKQQRNVVGGLTFKLNSPPSPPNAARLESGIRAPALPSRSRASASREIRRVVPAIRSYRHAVVLVMEMGGDAHSFRSITSVHRRRAL